MKRRGRDLPARYIWFKKLACIVCGFKAGKTSSISTKYSRSHLEISDALRQQQLRLFKADKRLREREDNEKQAAEKVMKCRIIDSVKGGGLTEQSGHFWWSRMISPFLRDCGKLLVILRKILRGSKFLFFSAKKCPDWALFLLLLIHYPPPQFNKFQKQCSCVQI